MNRLITQIGYVEIATPNRDAWLALGATVGCQTVRLPNGDAALRLDNDRNARIFFKDASEEYIIMGWQAADKHAFETVFDRLEAAGAQPKHDAELANLRKCEAVARFVDPDGFACELYWGAATAMRTQFFSPHQVQFVAGALGFGHVTMAVRDMEKSRNFYTDILGLYLSEVADVGALSVAFLNANTRHHSLAITQLPSGEARHDHVMLEVAHLDDLGGLRDRLFSDGLPLDRDLGRHPTDNVVSMYIKTPSPFTLEVGWGSVHVGPDWDNERYHRSGWSWGHKKLDDSGAPIMDENLGDN